MTTIQGKYLNDIRTHVITNKGFTGTMVYNETLDTVFKGASPKEGYIALSLISDTGKKKAVCCLSLSHTHTSL